MSRNGKGRVVPLAVRQKKELHHRVRQNILDHPLYRSLLTKAERKKIGKDELTTEELMPIQHRLREAEREAGNVTQEMLTALADHVNGRRHGTANGNGSSGRSRRDRSKLVARACPGEKAQVRMGAGMATMAR